MNLQECSFRIPVSYTHLDVYKRQQSMNSKVILISLFAIGGLLLWLLLKLRQLVKLQQTEELAGLNATRATSFADLYKKYNYIGKGILVILGILAAYGIWNWLMWIGVYNCLLYTSRCV